jgi:hypothetical protein
LNEHVFLTNIFGQTDRASWKVVVLLIGLFYTAFFTCYRFNISQKNCVAMNFLAEMLLLIVPNSTFVTGYFFDLPDDRLKETVCRLTATVCRF